MDRSSYPAKLTLAGFAVLKIAFKIIDELNRCKLDIGDMNEGPLGSLTFAMPHSLSIGFFPSWRTEMEAKIGRVSTKVITGNIHDCAQLLDSAACDFVLFYNFDLVPTYNFADPKFSHAYIGVDYLIPVWAPDANGSEMIDLLSDTRDPIPYLSWSQPTLVNHVLAELTRANKLDSKLQLCYQNQLAAAIREEDLLGRALAWLPRTLIQDDLENRKLIRASRDLDVTMRIGIACSSSTSTNISKKWWNHIVARHS